jgi:hypothetical protein
VIVCPLTQDFDWDEYVDLDADAALGGAFAVTPFMLDGF